MKKLRLLAAALLCAAVLMTSAGCVKKAAVGPRLSHNIARVYTPQTRVSRFVLDGALIDGEASGMAFMDSSADGQSGLAWVDTAVWFVSRAGVVPLGTGVGTAELSFDGTKVVYLEGNELKLYSSEEGASSVIDSGLDSVTQIAISPSGRSIMFTAAYEGEGKANVTKLWRGGELTEFFEGLRATVIAVSDDAQTVYYFNNNEGSFCVDGAGGTQVISAEVGAETNYNFTNDLSEAAFNTKDGKWRLFRLADGSLSELDEGFEYTLKTDVYSINTVNLFVYINDVSTFEDGLWLKRVKYDDFYTYSVAVMGRGGSLDWLFENASQYAAAPDGSRVVWLSGGQLYSTDMKGKNTQLASDVSEFVLSDDGKLAYLLSGDVLYCARGAAKAQRIASGVREIASIGGRCMFIDGEGALRSALGSEISDVIFPDASYMDKRAGQLIVYTSASGAGDETLYSAYFTADGESFTLAGEGVRP